MKRVTSENNSSVEIGQSQLPLKYNWKVCFMKHNCQVIKHTVSVGISLISEWKLNSSAPQWLLASQVNLSNISTCQCLEIIIDTNHSIWNNEPHLYSLLLKAKLNNAYHPSTQQVLTCILPQASAFKLIMTLYNRNPD